MLVVEDYESRMKRSRTDTAVKTLLSSTELYSVLPPPYRFFVTEWLKRCGWEGLERVGLGNVEGNPAFHAKSVRAGVAFASFHLVRQQANNVTG